MRFEVKTRNAKGSIDYITVEAADRSALFADLKAKNITAIQVRALEGKAKPSAPRKVASSGAPISGKVKGLLALVVVCVIGAVVFMFVSKEEPKPMVEEKKLAKEKRIEVVKPEIAPVVAESPKVEKTEPIKLAPAVPPTNVVKDANGVYRYPGGARWRDPSRPTQKIEIKDRIATMFKHPAERQIAGLLEARPGDMVFGTMMYGKNLEKDFLASLEEPYVYDKDESAEDRELRIAVEETKREIKARMEKGEDFVQMLKDTREELQKLGAFRNELKAEVDKVISDGRYTDQDVADFTEAANKMLEKEGLPPLKAPGVLMRQLKLRNAERRHQNAQPQE